MSEEMNDSEEVEAIEEDENDTVESQFGSVEVTATIKKTGQTGACIYYFGEDLDEAVELFGSDVVMAFFVAQAKVALQARIRSCLKRGQNPEMLADTWKPGVLAPRLPTDPKAAAIAAFTMMSEEERKQALLEIQASLQG